MTLATIDVLERTRNRVAPDAPARLHQQIDYVIETALDAALSRLGREAANSSEFKGLQKVYPVTPIAGVADISGSPTYDLILIDSIETKGAVMLATGTTPVVKVPRYQSLFTKLQADTVHYFLRGRELHFRALDGTLGTFVTPIKIVANRIPILSDLPYQFEDTLIDTLTQIVGTKLAPLLHSDEDQMPSLKE